MNGYMTVPALLLLAWCAWTLVLILPHARPIRALWREPVLNRPVVIIESDDWGPGPQSDAVMLQRIAGQLASIRDQEGRPAVMTLGLVLGKPDGKAILADHCRTYHRSALEEASYAPIVEAIRAGCAAGVFSLQRHGLEHCWPDSLLFRARDDEELRQWLADEDTRSETLPSVLQSRWADTKTLPSRSLPLDDICDAVREEGEAFERLFGERPAVAVPNTFVWSEAVEQAWAADGVRCVVTCGRQFMGRGSDGALTPPTRLLFNGESGPAGVRYVVRDVYFEPIRGHRAEQLWEGVAEHSALGRPALIETHRESFIASSEQAENALAELIRAMRGVTERHDDVCFLTTAALNDVFSAHGSALVSSHRAVCAYTFIRRLLALPVLSRPLKLSGLRLLLPMLASLLEFVTPASHQRSKGC